ncbi:MAG: cation transporter [Candidatus Thorarchaeota archaeon]
MKEIKLKDFTKAHKGITRLSYEVTQILENDPNGSPLFALLYVIEMGENTKQKIYDYFKYFYVNEFSYIRLNQPELDEILLIGIQKELIKEEKNTYLLTEKGNDVFLKSKKVNSITNKAIGFFFSEKVVLVLSLVCLIFMSSLKIITGLISGSDALFNEGIENFTDIIKIFIITLSIKLKKDKLGAILIIVLMLITGINLVISSIFSLIQASIVNPSYFSFILMFLSILINLMLLILKNFVGKLQANFALLSDAKDNVINIRLSLGVIVGLIFALFRIYTVDSIISLVIASLLILDGITTLIQLIKSGEDIDIDSFKLSIDKAFDFKIADWILVVIQEESLPKTQLNEKFLVAIKKGYDIFGVWAIFGLANTDKFNIHKILTLMEKRGLFYEQDNRAYLTDKGIEKYHNAITQEITRISREKKKYKEWKPPSKRTKVLWGIFGVIIPILLVLLVIFIGPLIYNFCINLIK